MPGMSLVCDASRDERREHAVAAALDGLLHDPRYAKRVLHRDASRLLALTAYPQYPIASFRCGDSVAWVEGRLYGLSESSIAQRIGELAEIVAGDSSAACERWIANQDGDFVVCVLDSRRGTVHVVTDALGRLPLYLHHSPGLFVLSRELSFVARLLPRLRFDRMGVAQLLLIGYPLGGRTLVDDVTRPCGASWISFDAGLREVRARRFDFIDLQTTERSRYSTRRNAEELAASFTEACEMRFGADRTNVVSLSGGFDSRAIAGGLHAARRPFVCATYLDHMGTAAADIAPAERVAQALGASWKLTRLGPPRPRDVLELLRMKSGMNPLGMSFLLPFLRDVAETWGGSLVFATGTLGTFLLPEIVPPLRLNGVEEVVDYLLRQSRRLPLGLVASLTTLEEADILAELRAHVLASPESDLLSKLAHFVLRERAFNWHGEADDRNRCFFWTTSPFDSLKVIRRALGCPDAQKRYFGLYREFLLCLSQDAAAVDHAAYRLPITSPAFRSAARAASLLAQHPRAVDRLAAAPSVYDASAMVIRLLRRQLASCPLLGEFLETQELERIVGRCDEHPRADIDLIFTCTSAIEWLGTGRSVLQSDGSSLT